jgi:hypothetical protein
VSKTKVTEEICYNDPHRIEIIPVEGIWLPTKVDLDIIQIPIEQWHMLRSTTKANTIFFGLVPDDLLTGGSHRQ